MPRRLDGVRVLVAEDHPASGRLLAAILEGAGAEVSTVESAEAALSIIEVFRPTVLVVDLVLPGMSGQALVATLKSNAATRSIVCIAVTVLNGRDVDRDVEEAGCAALLLKPFDAETLVALVAEHAKERK